MIRRISNGRPTPVPDAVPARKGEPLLPNAWIVARREYVQRVRTRSFVLGTVFLMLLAFGAALIPVLTTFMDRETVSKMAVYAADAGLSFDPVPVISKSLNGAAAAASPDTSPAPSSAASAGPASSPTPRAEFSVTGISDLAAARAQLRDGAYKGLIIISRGPSGDPTFELVSDTSPDGRTAFFVQQAASAIAITDRIERLDISADQQVTLFAPIDYSVTPADPSKPQESTTSLVSRSLTANILVILIFVTVITYGTWVAQSVAEEKSSRVMELMLSAATPLQMLAGKVSGVGTAGLTQYAGILAAGLVGIALQGPITTALVPGSAADVPTLAGLTPGVLATFVGFFTLGFALYALVYAAAGSLVSRQEEVQQVVTPLTFISMGGYFAAIFAASAGSPAWVVFLSYFPFSSPYVMLVRVIDGSVAPWEPVIAGVILLATIAIMLVLAARVYSAGVLLYGQRPTLGALIAAARVRR